MTRHTKTYLKTKSLAILRKDLLLEWDFEQNTKSPSDVSLGSNYRAFWVCSSGHSFTQKVCHRTRQNGLGCPVCAGRLSSNIVEGMPELYRLWDQEKNKTLNPNKLSPGSQKVAWFACDNNHSYERKIGTVRTAILKGREPCPYCNKSLPSDEYNLSILYPNVASEWDTGRNNSSPSAHLPSENNNKYWWLCKLGHSYQMTINARTNQGSGCPYCAGQAVDESNSLRATHAHLIEEWDYTKNATLTPDELTAGSNKTVWWKCKYGHSWKAAVYSRASGKGCAHCSNQTSRPELRLLTELEMVFEKVKHRAKRFGNEYDIYIPDYSTGIEYDGAAFHQNHERDVAKNNAAHSRGIALIRIREQPLQAISEHDIILDQDNVIHKKHINRLISIVEKSVDRKRVISYINKTSFQNSKRYNELVKYLPGPLPGRSFADRYPNLMKEWDYDKNSPLKPHDVSYGSNIEVSWRCVNNHTFKMSPKTRHHGQNCPFCSGRRLAPERSLGSRYPELIAEWDEFRNQGKTPFDFTFASHHNAWWICPNGHSYQAKISSRTRKPRGSGCKTCFDNRGKNTK